MVLIGAIATFENPMQIIELSRNVDESENSGRNPMASGRNSHKAGSRMNQWIPRKKCTQALYKKLLKLKVHEQQKSNRIQASPIMQGCVEAGSIVSVAELPG
jgi:hypothetical protein